MALYVFKFGGTSLATMRHIQCVVDHICKVREAGDQVIVVVSAMGGETNRLIKLANTSSITPQTREYAELLSCGEQMSMSLLTLSLSAKGCAAKSFKPGVAGIYTTDDYENAQIVQIDTDNITQALAEGIVPIIAGFQGLNSRGEITTLARGGSDATAVALAHAMDADECQIYTDVSGIHTVDPAVLPEAPCLSSIRADELLALCSAGARIVQSYALELAICYRVPLRVKSTFDDGVGTKVIYDGLRALIGKRIGMAFQYDDGQKMLIEDREPATKVDGTRMVSLTMVHAELARSSAFSSKLLNLLKNKGIKVYAESGSAIALSALIKENDVRPAAALLHAELGGARRVPVEQPVREKEAAI